MLRVFVALDIAEDVKDEISRFCCGLPGARWVQDNQFHLTLHFIGEVDGAAFRDIRESLADMQGQPLEMRLQGIGVFPPRKIPKVLWVGVSKNEQLSQLHKSIGSALRKAGVAVEKRKFAPHVTLARLRNAPKEKVAQFVASHNLYASRVMSIETIALYSSALTSKGAIHTLEELYPLGA